MTTIHEKLAELDAIIEEHQSKHHRDGVCYSGYDGCCGVHQEISEANRLAEIIRWPDGTPNISPALGAKYGRYNCASEPDEAFLRRMGIEEVA